MANTTYIWGRGRLEDGTEAGQDVVHALHNLNFSVQSVEGDYLVESVCGFVNEMLNRMILKFVRACVFVELVDGQNGLFDTGEHSSAFIGLKPVLSAGGGLHPVQDVGHLLIIKNHRGVGCDFGRRNVDLSHGAV